MNLHDSHQKTNVWVQNKLLLDYGAFTRGHRHPCRPRRLLYYRRRRRLHRDPRPVLLMLATMHLASLRSPSERCGGRGEDPCRPYPVGRCSRSARGGITGSHISAPLVAPTRAIGYCMSRRSGILRCQEVKKSCFRRRKGPNLEGVHENAGSLLLLGVFTLSWALRGRVLHRT